MYILNINTKKNFGSIALNRHFKSAGMHFLSFSPRFSQFEPLFLGNTGGAHPAPFRNSSRIVENELGQRWALHLDPLLVRQHRIKVRQELFDVQERLGTVADMARIPRGPGKMVRNPWEIYRNIGQSHNICRKIH